jgi:hypothetical protein
MKKFYFFFTGLSIIIYVSFLYGCATGAAGNDPYYVNAARQEANIYHAPATKTISLLTEKNQIMVGGNLSMTPNLDGFELQAGYMLTDHIGFIGGYSNMEYGVSDNYIIFSNYHPLGALKGFEFAAGYVSRLSPNMHIESYIGYARSKMNNIHHTGMSELGQNSFFLQPAFGLNSTNNKIQFAVMSRLSRGNYRIEHETYNKDREKIVAANIDAYRNHPIQVFLEPGVVLRMGSDWFKAQLTYSVLTRLSGGKQKTDDNNFSFGIILQGPKKKINNKSPVK